MVRGEIDPANITVTDGGDFIVGDPEPEDEGPDISEDGVGDMEVLPNVLDLVKESPDA